MNITAYFASSGTPATGLSPIINIRDLSDNSLVITGAAMSEVGDGFYKYTFAGYDTAKNYTIRCDGGVGLLAADRYSIATTGHGEDFTATEKTSLNAATPAASNMRGTDNAALATDLGTVDTVVDAIKVQTDKLTFTVANQVDSNIQSVNDKTLIGNGSTIPWGPE